MQRPNALLSWLFLTLIVIEAVLAWLTIFDARTTMIIIANIDIMIVLLALFRAYGRDSTQPDRGQKVFAWIFPAFLLSGIALIRNHMLDESVAVIVSSAFELFVLIIVVREIIRVRRSYKRGESQEYSLEAIIETELARFFPPSLARFIALEPRVWISVFRWLFRRRPLQMGEFSYDKRTIFGAILALLLLTTPVEVLLYELLLPWLAVRVILLVLSLYSIVWMAGLRASLRVLPHRLEPNGIRLHYGILAEGYIPYCAIAQVSRERKNAPKSEGLQIGPDRATAFLAAGGKTDLTLHLATPIAVQGLLKKTPALGRIHVAVDNPIALAQALEERIASANETDSTAESFSQPVFS